MMQVMTIVFAIFLFFSLIEMLGYVCECWIKDHHKHHSRMLMGFFLYFCMFQLIYLPLLFLKMPLHVLQVVWSIVCVLIIFLFFTALAKKYHNLSDQSGAKTISSLIQKRIKDIKPDNRLDFTFCLGVIMCLLLALQIYLSVISGFNGWDTAYYISTVVQAVDTDTMYIFDGYSGVRDTVINIRYAMSSFYMHSALVADIFQVHGAIVCRFFNAVVCHLLSACVIYRIGKEIWQDKKHACALVIFWILANLGISTMYLPSCFLYIRSYEAKTYCANIVLPVVILVMLQICKNADNKKKWLELMIINIASVAISSSCLLLVPFLEGIWMIVYLVTTKRFAEIWKMVLCLLPSIFYLGLYIIDRFDIWKIVIS